MRNLYCMPCARAFWILHTALSKPHPQFLHTFCTLLLPVLYSVRVHIHTALALLASSCVHIHTALSSAHAIMEHKSCHSCFGDHLQVPQRSSAVQCLRRVISERKWQIFVPRLFAPVSLLCLQGIVKYFTLPLSLCRGL